MNELMKIESKNKLIETGNKVYDTQVKMFNKYLQGREANIGSVCDYLEHIKSTKSASTFLQVKVALKKAILKTYQKQAMNIFFVSSVSEVFKNIKTPKSDKKILEKDVLNKKDVDTMIENSNERIALIIKTLSITGLRVSELLNIKIDHCTIIKRVVHVKIIGKGKKERVIQMPKALLEKIIDTFKSHSFLFENKQTKKAYTRMSLFRFIREAGKLIERENLHPHHLRHFFATHHIKTKKHTVKAVSNYLGHSSTAITNDMYVHDQLTSEQLFDDDDLF